MNNYSKNFEVAKGALGGSIVGMISGSIIGSLYSFGIYSTIKRTDLSKELENLENTSKEKNPLMNKSFSLAMGISHNVSKYIAFGTSIYHGIENIIETVQTQDISNLEYSVGLGIATNILSIAYEKSSKKTQKKINNKAKIYLRNLNEVLEASQKA